MEGMGKPSILAIERDWRLRRLIRANLEVLGLKVCEAADWQQGLSLVRANRPDLILLDLDLAEEEGPQLLADLHTLHGRPVPILLLGTEPPSRSLIQQEGVAGYLQKPFAVPALLEQVQWALNGAGS